MKRYLAFAGPDYYPEGGMSDLVGEFDDLEQAVLACTQTVMEYTAKEDIWHSGWAHILDCAEGAICWEKGKQANKTIKVFNGP